MVSGKLRSRFCQLFDWPLTISLLTIWNTRQPVSKLDSVLKLNEKTQKKIDWTR